MNEERILLWCVIGWVGGRVPLAPGVLWYILDTIQQQLSSPDQVCLHTPTRRETQSLSHIRCSRLIIDIEDRYIQTCYCCSRHVHMCNISY